MTKLSRTYRLDKDVVEQINDLQDFYKTIFNVHVSQSDVIQILVRDALASVPGEKTKKD